MAVSSTAQARWTLAKLRQRFKDGGVLFDSPNEVVSTTAQNVQWFDPVLLQKPLNGLLHWLLDGEHAFRFDKRFRRMIEVDVLNIEIRKQCVAVPEGTADFETIIQKRI